MKTKQETVIATINSALAGWAQYFDVAFDSDLVDDEDSYDALFTITPKPFDSDDGRVVGAPRTLEFVIIGGDVSLITGEDNEHDVTTANLFAALYFDTLTILDQAAPLAVDMQTLQDVYALGFRRAADRVKRNDLASVVGQPTYLSDMAKDLAPYAPQPQPAGAVPQAVSDEQIQAVWSEACNPSAPTSEASGYSIADEVIDRLRSGGESILELCTKEYSDGYRMAIFHAEQIIDWLKGASADDWRSSIVAEKNHLLDLAGRFVSHTESYCEDSELSPEFLELLNDMREAIKNPSPRTTAAAEVVKPGRLRDQVE